MASLLLLGSSSPVVCRSPFNGHGLRHKQLIALKGYESAHHQQPVLGCTVSSCTARAVVVSPTCCHSDPAVIASSRPRSGHLVNVTCSSSYVHQSLNCHGSMLHGSRQRSSSWDSSSSSARVGAAAGPGDSAQGHNSDHNADISGGSGILDDAGAGSGRGRVGGSSSGGGSGGSGSSGSSTGDSGAQPKSPVWYTVWMWCTALVYLVWRWRWRRDRRLAAEQFEREQQAEEQLKQDWQTFAQQYKATGKSAATAAAAAAAVRPLEDHRR